MNKIKKVFISIGAFFTGLVSKVSAMSLSEQTKYGVFDPRVIEDKYGVFDPSVVEPTVGERLLNVGKFALPIVLFFIGLLVVLSKKLTKKVKTIAVSVLVLLAILGYVLMKYIATNF